MIPSHIASSYYYYYYYCYHHRHHYHHHHASAAYAATEALCFGLLSLSASETSSFVNRRKTNETILMPIGTNVVRGNGNEAVNFGDRIRTT